MGKLLLLIAALFAVIAVLRLLMSQRQAACDASPLSSKTATLQTLLPCPHCDIYIAPNEQTAHNAMHARTD